MRIVVFGNERRVGALQGEHVVDLARAHASLTGGKEALHGQPLVPSSLLDFIAGGQATLDAAQRAIEHAVGSGPDAGLVPLASTRLHAPWPGKRVACTGGNYAAHLVGMERGRFGAGASDETADMALARVTAKAREGGQWGFWKVLDEAAGPDDDVPYPSRAEYFDFEAEAAIVLGRRGKNIPADQLDRYVWGVTLANDWSIRDPGGAPKPMSYNLAKNFDRSLSLGPCIVVGELDPADVEVALSINGQERQRYATRDMVWSFAEVLEFLSRDFTLVPGDVILGGTSAGTAQDSSPLQADGKRARDLFLKVGDVVEVTSPQVGALRNRIVGD